MATAVRARADSLGMPASQYVHETLLAEMTKAGIEAPEHRKLAHDGSEMKWSTATRRWTVVSRPRRSKRKPTLEVSP